MRVFKNRQFVRLASSAGLSDGALKVAILEVQQGLVDAELGGNLIKKRVAVGGKGKRGGLRTILVYKTLGNNLFCIYVFAKNEKENISTKELAQLKLLAKNLLLLNDAQIRKAVDADELVEVIIDEEKYKGKSRNNVDDEVNREKRGEKIKRKENNRR